MMVRRRSLACCTWDRGISIDLDEQDGVITYNGLESCIASNQSYENESGTGTTSQGDGCMSDSMDYDDDLSCSSSKSFTSKWLNNTKKGGDRNSDDWELSESPKHFHVKSKPDYSVQFSDVETMKETFAKLLLGEDITGGRDGLTAALSLSNGISNLAASVFGELWKLEPLPQESKNKWRREMDWFLSPTNYMVELVPTKQNGENGRTVEIMTPKTRADIHVNLPALQKLDSMLLETLDSMVNTEFWYSEIGSRAEGRTKSGKQSKRWWLPLPQVPKNGLSESERKNLLNKSKVVYQVFKAAKSINENVLLEMPVPNIIRDALHKSGKANLGEEMHKILTDDMKTADDMLNALDLKSEHSAVDVINKLESAIIAWKEKITPQTTGKSPVRTSWSLVKDTMSEFEKTESLLERAEALVQQVKARYLNLPHTFLEATKIQYGKDVGHSILEAYSRVVGNLAFSILCRMGDIFQEDASSNPNSPLAICCFPGILETPLHVLHKPHSLVDQISKTEGKYRDSDASYASDIRFSYSEEGKGSSVSATPSRSRVWCIGREACISVSPSNSP
ncbi:rop guanine nucleotide exchange factor 14 [Euphorbia lathyris]|uniref:rop guanine nucleotide exchange factor 14 n=1 Tax=Euphorbia lathyris TaxID=212925 RepID=UPI0033131782